MVARIMFQLVESHNSTFLKPKKTNFCNPSIDNTENTFSDLTSLHLLQSLAQNMHPLSPKPQERCMNHYNQKSSLQFMSLGSSASLFVWFIGSLPMEEMRIS